MFIIFPKFTCIQGCVSFLSATQDFVLFSLAFDADEFEFNSEDAVMSGSRIFLFVMPRKLEAVVQPASKINKDTQTTVNVQLKEFHNNNKIKRPTKLLFKTILFHFKPCDILEIFKGIKYLFIVNHTMYNNEQIT